MIKPSALWTDTLESLGFPPTPLSSWIYSSRSEEIIVEDVTAFYEALSELLKYRMIDTYPAKPEYHNEAYKLGNRYKALTYFSLHAAVALIESQELVSYHKQTQK